MNEKNQLDRLAKEARAEIEAYHGLLRRAGVHLFRAGGRLFEAKSLVKEAGVTWADWLRQEKLAESTARQAIDLYRNAKAMGHEEIDLESLSITDAKIKYGIVAPKPKKAKEVTPPPTSPVEDITPPPDAEGGTSTQSPAGWPGTAPQPPEGKGRSHEAKGQRSREVVLRELEEIYGEETEELPLRLPLKTWKLLDILMFQEEVDDLGQVLSRAVREYWLRHGDPANVQTRGLKTESELVYSEVTA